MKLQVTSLVLGLVAIGLAIGFELKQRENRALASEVTKLARQNADLRFELKQATKRAEDFGRHAVELDSQLGSAKTRTTATESKHAQLNRELHETKSQLSEREQREVALLAELAMLREKLTGTAGSAANAIAVAGVADPGLSSAALAKDGPGSASPSTESAPPVDVPASHRRIAELEQQLTELLTRALSASQPEPAPAAPASHQVVRVGPRDSFVVLDLGADHGARANEIIAVRHGTSEVARVQISDVRPRFSVAQVLPGTLKGQLQTGDLVVFTH